ncbi:MAG TPA: hypothetical protein PK156_36635 [Polyangium sp.]|nr:hypothetical protein [Polyangium sp.]
MYCRQIGSCLQIVLVAALGFGAEGCGTPGGSGESSGGPNSNSLATCSGDVFVSGTVTREITPTTWNEPFVPTADAHVVMQLEDYLLDGPATVVAERDLPFESLPFEFAICGDAQMIEAMRKGQLTVDISVYNHADATIHIGDLLDEYANDIDGPTQGLSIKVSGVEDCNSPNAGGYCTSTP